MRRIWNTFLARLDKSVTWGDLIVFAIIMDAINRGDMGRFLTWIGGLI